MWIVKEKWTPIDDYDPEWIELRFLSREQARHHGLSDSCCAGLRRILIYSPEGELLYSYDRKDNHWFDHEEMAGYMVERFGWSREDSMESIRLLISDEAEDIRKLDEALPVMLDRLKGIQ